jgi:uncharacterized protein DUF2752
MTSEQKKHFVAVFLPLGGLGLLLLQLFDPATSRLFPPCPLHYLTGWYCPGCGSLRALHQLLHGNFEAAWAMNPLTILLLPFLIYGLTSEALSQLRGRGLPQVFLPAPAIRVLCVIIVLFGILRNLPVYPWNLLAPGAMLHI